MIAYTSNNYQINWHYYLYLHLVGIYLGLKLEGIFFLIILNQNSGYSSSPRDKNPSYPSHLFFILNCVHLKTNACFLWYRYQLIKNHKAIIFYQWSVFILIYVKNYFQARYIPKSYSKEITVIIHCDENS